MPIKVTKEEIKRITSDLGYIFIDEYYSGKDKKHRKVIIEDEDGYKYDVDFNSLKNGSKCIVGSNSSISLYNISIWLLKNSKNFTVSNENTYTGTHDKLLFTCMSCHQNFYKSWSSISTNNEGCYYCSGKKAGKYNNLAVLRPDLLAEWDYIKNKINPYEATEFSSQPAYWICQECGNEWKTKRISTRTKGKNGCPKCKLSKGEKRINEILIIFNCNFSRQFWFKNCKNKNPLPFDFYLSDYNLCIEFHGIQHYEYRKINDFFGGEKEFKKRIKNDKIKEKYCKNNNINLLIIPYWEFGNIENILKETISELEGRFIK